MCLVRQLTLLPPKPFSLFPFRSSLVRLVWFVQPPAGVGTATLYCPSIEQMWTSPLVCPPAACRISVTTSVPSTMFFSRVPTTKNVFSKFRYGITLSARLAAIVLTNSLCDTRILPLWTSYHESLHLACDGFTIHSRMNVRRPRFSSLHELALFQSTRSHVVSVFFPF